MSSSKITARDRLAGALILTFVTSAMFVGHQPNVGSFTVLSLGVPYLIFVFPFQCRELTTRRRACTKSRWGWLIGCPDHTWQRLRRVFAVVSGGIIRREAPSLGRSRPSTRTNGMKASPLPPIPPPAPPGRPVYDGVILLATVVSAVVGVIAVL